MRVQIRINIQGIMVLKLKYIRLFSIFIISLEIILFPKVALAIGGNNYISFSADKDYFTICEKGTTRPLIINSTDYTGVIRAFNDLKTDIFKVTGVNPVVSFDKIPSQKEIIIAGTLGKSAILNKLIKSKKLDVSSIEGKWENFLIQTIQNPFPGVDKALVIAGSDKRGTIYGIYDISEKIGVSPWYFWSDVPVAHNDNIFVKPGKYIEGPGVKYRGIFINDEAPSLTNWIKFRYGKVTPSVNPPVPPGVGNYNHLFYANIFELLLRLKANYLWPAMWDNAFNEDDPQDPILADEYGIVMGTSHQEPMMRAQQEWDRRYYDSLGHWDYYKHPEIMENFWREGIRRNKNYENIVTMGLRGANDTEISGDIRDNISMVENIVNKQQKILKEEVNSDINKIPQLWCLYKEIMDYYNQGLRVPENITLLWSDDNWGNIRRLPDDEERKRAGGAGVYYHFDYHGDPRSYEWINTNPIAKIWDQMALAKQYGADKIWIVNVGHFKGYELPTEYFMNLAWNPALWNNENINEYTRLWCAREFGPEYAGEIAEILSKYTKYNGRRKPESLTQNTYSISNYGEAETVLNDFRIILSKAETIYSKLPANKKEAYYQTVLFPVKASALVNEIYITAAQNQLYATQKRASTNEMAEKTRLLFQEDTSLMRYYNTIYAQGKWNHFMDQTHLGYTSWRPPSKNSMDGIHLSEINIPDSSILGVCTDEWKEQQQETESLDFDPYSNRRHFIDLFRKGNKPCNYSISTDVNWLSFDEPEGLVTDDKRILIIANTELMPRNLSEGWLTIKDINKEIKIKVKGFKPENEAKNSFIESNGVISIEAEHYSGNIPQDENKWIKIEDYGLTLSGMRATSVPNAVPATPGKDAACLEYPVYLVSKDSAQINLVISPVLNFMPHRKMRIAVSLDNENPKYITIVPEIYKVHVSNPDWSKTVLNQARVVNTSLPVVKTGQHTLKIWMTDPGVVLEKIIINMGGLKPSYLGPPESVYVR